MNPTPASTSVASGSGSIMSGNTTGAAAAAAKATRPAMMPKAELALTPGLEQLNEAQIAAAFMGETVEVKAPTQKEATNEEETEETAETETTEETETTAEEETETEEATAETEEEAEAESDLEKGLEKAKLSPGMRKRFKALLKENPELKRELETLKLQVEAKQAEPDVVTPAHAGNLFATARNAAEVEQHAADVLDDAETKLDWLDTHRDGGVWGKGENAVKYTAEQVAEFRTHYRKLIRGVDSQKAARLDWLKRYAETLKGISADKANELVKPTVETRESRYARHIMAEPDFLEFLADAKAGREQREKSKQGIKFVEVKPGAKATAKPGGETPPVNGSKPMVKQAAPVAKADRSPAYLEKLRARAAAGNAEAQEELHDWFMAT
jgi:hypothetical protein